MAASAGGDGRERKPLVSIVIVAGSGDRLPRAIESACRQSWVPTETVVVHDGTSAAIAAAIERYPGVRSVVHRDCGGRGAARNAGLGAIGGDYVAFIGGDDLLFPGAVAAGVAQLEADRAAALAVRRDLGRRRCRQSAWRADPAGQAGRALYCAAASRLYRRLRGGLVWPRRA
jgi:glycosyltransferase involved in cell wall biosynthesis